MILNYVGKNYHRCQNSLLSSGTADAQHRGYA
jgi:hypothetical protein